jgi:hypothetical protein
MPWRRRKSAFTSVSLCLRNEGAGNAPGAQDRPVQASARLFRQRRGDRQLHPNRPANQRRRFGPLRATGFDLATSVDQTEAGNAESRIALGVSDLRALGTSACLRMSMGPTRATRRGTGAADSG